MEDGNGFDPAPSTEDGYATARTRLRRAFATWAKTTGSDLSPDSFEQLIHYKWGYLDRHLTCWRRADLDKVLLELFPAKVIVEDDELDEILPETAAFISFLSDTGLLDGDRDDPQLLHAHLGTIEDRFYTHMADPSRYSPGKRFFLAAGEAGVRPDDQQAVNAFIEQFNTRPLAERDAVLGRGARAKPPATSAGRFTPPGTPPRHKPTARRRRRG